MAHDILEVKGLDVFRGNVQVLRGLNLEIGKDEMVALVGRNGAGKTTTIKSIMGLLPVRKGKIIYKGKDITNLAAYKRARMGIGFSPEDSKIFPDLTASDNLHIAMWFGGAKSGADVEARALEFFPELKRLLGRRGLYLSGGEKKMLAIARGLALSPSLLLLDEVFEGLAPIVVSRFVDAVKKIKELGIAVLVAESNLTNAARIAERLYAIDRGEIIFEGDPKKAFDSKDVMKILRGY